MRLSCLHDAAIFLLVAGATSAAYATCGVPPPPPTCTPASFNPANPAASGYVMVFGDTFQNSATIDTSNSGAAGFHWYVNRFFGFGVEPAGNIPTGANGLFINDQGPVQYNIGTAGPSANTQGWVGTTFSGGAYFEAVIAFDGPGVVASGYNGFPAFWSMAVEHMANKGADQAPGQPTNYVHFMEDDFFEYANLGDPTHAWDVAMHDWFEYQNNGLHNPSCDTGFKANTGSFCDISNSGASLGSPYNTNIARLPGSPVVTWNTSTPHTIGHLWVSGNTANGNLGYTQNFLDNAAANGTGQSGSTGPFAPLSKTGWSTASPIPANVASLYGDSTNQAWQIMDQQHMVVLLGTGTVPFNVKAIRIWQIPSCGAMNH